MNLHFRQLGQGQPLLILHGLFGSSDNWMTIAKQLANNYNVFLIDQRNHGQSPHSDEWNYEVMAKDIIDFCEQHYLQQIFIAGHSMGGKTVMKLAELAPALINKMMIIDIAPRFYPVHHQQILSALKSIDFNIINNRKQAEEFLQNAIEEPATRQFLLKNIYWNSENKLAWRFNLEVIAKKIEIVGEATPDDNYSICTIPACFIKGANSTYITLEDEKLIAHLYPNADVLTIADAGHWVHAENPAAMMNAMTNFFKY
jgi:pimeloyl-ACP methyl ester carboxylesterase